MAKKEKIAAVMLTISMTLLICSSIYTLYQNKPLGYNFRVEKILRDIKNK